MTSIIWIPSAILIKSLASSEAINIPEDILYRLKEARDPLKEAILIASEQAKDFINIAEGIHIMAVKAEHLIPEILEKADLNLEC